MLTFEDAVILTDLLINYINTDQGKNILNQIGKKFNLRLKDNFMIKRGDILKNCPDCSGCHQGLCILGCMKTPGYDLCYWDEALEKIAGTGLITHELGHIWYGQAYENDFDSNNKKYLEQSEKYAQYVEDQFTNTLAFCLECQDFVIDLKKLSRNFQGIMDNQIINGLVLGIGFGIGSFIAALLIGTIKAKSETIREITE